MKTSLSLFAPVALLLGVAPIASAQLFFWPWAQPPVVCEPQPQPLYCPPPAPLFCDPNPDFHVYHPQPMAAPPRGRIVHSHPGYHGHPQEMAPPLPRARLFVPGPQLPPVELHEGYDSRRFVPEPRVEVSPYPSAPVQESRPAPEPVPEPYRPDPRPQPAPQPKLEPGVKDLQPDPVPEPVPSSPEGGSENVGSAAGPSPEPPARDQAQMPEESHPFATATSKAGIVTSPHPPYAKVDATGLEPGSLAIDPTSQMIFRVP